jgi:putative sugar O-methyltransferase
MNINYSRYKDVSGSLLNSMRFQKPNDFSESSHLWKSFFENRDSVSGISDLLISLNNRFSFAAGIGETLLSDSNKEIFIEYYKTFLERSQIEAHPLSWVGSPSIIEFDGLPVNSAYLSNLRLFYEIKCFLDRHYSDGFKPLNIIEIGAGYGGFAYFAIQSGLAASYTIIDLPENLFLSAFYLTQNFQDHSWHTFSDGNDLHEVRDSAIHFLLPGNIHLIDQCHYDLAINSDSLGEMPRKTANKYVDWIYDHLVEKGVFFSKNGHRRGTDCVQYPEDYGYQNFNLVELRAPTAVSSLFDDFSHYIFLEKSLEKQLTHSFTFFNDICWLYAVGLHQDLDEISVAFSENKLDQDQQFFLTICHQYFLEKSLKKKLKILNQNKLSNKYQFLVMYLKGITLYLLGHYSEAAFILRKYLENVPFHISEAYAIMIISRIDSSILDSQLKYGGRTKFVINELRGYFKMNCVFRYLAFKIRANNLLKKICIPQNYSPSILLRIKNLLFNFKEGKKVGVLR